MLTYLVGDKRADYFWDTASAGWLTHWDELADESVDCNQRQAPSNHSCDQARPAMMWVDCWKWERFAGEEDRSHEVTPSIDCSWGPSRSMSEVHEQIQVSSGLRCDKATVAPGMQTRWHLQATRRIDFSTSLKSNNKWKWSQSRNQFNLRWLWISDAIRNNLSRGEENVFLVINHERTIRSVNWSINEILKAIMKRNEHRTAPCTLNQSPEVQNTRHSWWMEIKETVKTRWDGQR